jgi:hypothetical protein
MKLVSTDKDIATRIVINKTVGGQPLSGYPKTYDMLGAFAEAPEITEDAWREMSYSEQFERIIAFKNHINGLEEMDIDATQTNDVFRDSIKS